MNSQQLSLRWLAGLLLSLLGVTMGSAAALAERRDFSHCTFAGRGVNQADNVIDGLRLRNQLTSQEIAGGHAFDKHVLPHGEFPGITTREQFQQHIESVINNPTATRSLTSGRTAWWDDETGTVVIRDPSRIDGGTAFKPKRGRANFDDLE